MKSLPADSAYQPMPLVHLKISTNIRLHPDFATAPISFCRERGVDLVDEVFPEMSYRNDPDSQEKTAKVKADIHLVRHRAIRLFIEQDNNDDLRLRSIDLNPSMLRYGAKNHPLNESDLFASLSSLKSSVPPLLADLRDASHIIPIPGDKRDSIAYWSQINSGIFLPGIPLECLHGLRHPLTGSAEGESKKRIQLVDESGNCILRFDQAKQVTLGSHCMRGEVHGIRVHLILKGHSLPATFGTLGTTSLLNNTRRLVAFHASSIARVHQTVMSQLEGTYLPVPPEWRDSAFGKPVTHAKTLALVSQLTSIPVGELREIDDKLRQPSDSTRKRLNKDLTAETGRLMPVPISTLFRPRVYAAQIPGGTPVANDSIDPLVFKTYCSRMCKQSDSETDSKSGSWILRGLRSPHVVSGFNLLRLAPQRRSFFGGRSPEESERRAQRAPHAEPSVGCLEYVPYGELRLRCSPTSGCQA
jgi:hypothetical protein